MYDVMEGVRVIEVAEHTFVPASSMLLAEWVADVIKVERVQGQGDPGCHLKLPGTGFVTPVTIDAETSYMAGAAPCQFDERSVGELRGGPGYGEHTEAILREIGMGERIAELRAASAIV